jgi:hypothetical protein
MISRPTLLDEVPTVACLDLLTEFSLAVSPGTLPTSPSASTTGTFDGGPNQDSRPPFMASQDEAAQQISFLNSLTVC